MPPPLKHGTEWANSLMSSETRRRAAVMDFDRAEGVGTDAALADWLRAYGAGVRAALAPDRDF